MSRISVQEITRCMATSSPKYSSFTEIIEFEIHEGAGGRGNLSLCFIMKIHRISSVHMQNISANDLHNLWICLYRVSVHGWQI